MPENQPASAGAVIAPGNIPYPWIRKELELDREYRRGDRGAKVKIIQEWLCLHDFKLVIDSQFGSATEHALRQYQKANGMVESGAANQTTFAALTRPMLRALTPAANPGNSYASMITGYAARHLKELPREVGGQNLGPWVRLYMHGNEGREWAWCAGFVCFILRQASDTLNFPMPFKTTFSCDTLAAQAKEKGLFVAGRNLSAGNPPAAAMPPGSIFLNRRTSTDWDHTGLVTRFGNDVFETIEGNTNDDGDREGYEVCRRFRAYDSKDFIRIS